MKKEILFELAARWDRDSELPNAPAVAAIPSEEERIESAKEQGHRECKRECADTLRNLIEMLGD